MTEFLFSKNEGEFQLTIDSIDKLCCINNSGLLLEKKNRREKEVLASSNMVKILYPNDEMAHNSHGAPTLSNNKAISLSHSKHYLACIVSENTAAVDIEPISSKAERLKNKFLNKQELALAVNSELTVLMWCAKECLYKIHQKGSLIFSKDLTVHSIDENKIKCSIFNQIYYLSYEKFYEHWLVYYFD